MTTNATTDLSCSLTNLYGEAGRSHTLIGAISFQRSEYRRSTDHYRRAIEYFLKQEEWTAAWSSSSAATSATADSDADNSTQHDQDDEASSVLIEEHCRMDVYNQVLLLEHSSELRTAAAASTCDQTQNGQQSNEESTDTETMSSCGRGAGTIRGRKVFAHREPFYMDQNGNSYRLDSNLASHLVSSSASLLPLEFANTTQSNEIAYGLSSAFVMYNLSLCHCALGAFDESLELLDMAQQIVTNSAASNYVPEDLRVAIVGNKRYIRGVNREASAWHENVSRNSLEGEKQIAPAA